MKAEAEEVARGQATQGLGPRRRDLPEVRTEGGARDSSQCRFVHVSKDKQLPESPALVAVRGLTALPGVSLLQVLTTPSAFPSPRILSGGACGLALTISLVWRQGTVLIRLPGSGINAR